HQHGTRLMTPAASVPSLTRVWQPLPRLPPGGGLESGLDAEVSAQLLLFVEQTTDFVGVADGWGRVIYLNPAACKRLGVLDATGLTLADVFPAEETAFYYEVVRGELLRAGAWSGEVRVKIPGDGAVKMHLSTTAMIGPGGAIN